MEPKPVEHYPAPKYPTRRDVMLGTGGLLLTDLAGCSEAGGAEGAKPPAGGTIVAPIFKHGEGRGATGCVVIAPPVFLSEEEAMQIIREELAKHGVKLGDPMTLADVKIWPRFEHLETEEHGGKRELKRRVREDQDHAPVALKLNGVDRGKNVAVRFVSKSAYYSLGGPSNSYTEKTPSGRRAVMSTVQTYDFREVAEYVATELKEQGDAEVYVGLLYDPAMNGRDVEERKDESRQERRACARAKSVELLREQARDFAAWLKQQEVL